MKVSAIQVLLLILLAARGQLFCDLNLFDCWNEFYAALKQRLTIIEKISDNQLDKKLEPVMIFFPVHKTTCSCSDVVEIT